MTSEAKSPLLLGLSERLGPSHAALNLPESESGDCADSVAAVHNLADIPGTHEQRASVLDCGGGVGDVEGQ